MILAYWAQYIGPVTARVVFVVLPGGIAEAELDRFALQPPCLRNMSPSCLPPALRLARLPPILKLYAWQCISVGIGSSSIATRPYVLQPCMPAIGPMPTAVGTGTYCCRHMPCGYRYRSIAPGPICLRAHGQCIALSYGPYSAWYGPYVSCTIVSCPYLLQQGYPP